MPARRPSVRVPGLPHSLRRSGYPYWASTSPSASQLPPAVFGQWRQIAPDPRIIEIRRDSLVVDGRRLDAELVLKKRHVLAELVDYQVVCQVVYPAGAPAWAPKVLVLGPGPDILRIDGAQYTSYRR